MSREEAPSPASAGAPTVFLHIGTPKSGTTYLQSRMNANRHRAEAQGLLWPGTRHEQQRAVDDLNRLPAEEPLDPDGPWSRLARTARSWPGDKVLISMERLVASSDHQIAAAVTSLAPCRVEIVCTVRDLARTFVAQWQEMTKYYRNWTWQQFTREMSEGADSGPSSRRFWDQHDVPRILRRWMHQIPVERIHLITVPAPGSAPELLWERFCSALGCNGSDFAEPTEQNPSLGVSAAVLMCRLNTVARAHKIRRRLYMQVFHDRLAMDVLPKAGARDGVAFPAEMRAWCHSQADDLVDQLRGLGVQVIGDLDELVPRAFPQGRRPEDVTDSELLTLALEALVRLAAAQGRALRRRGPT